MNVLTRIPDQDTVVSPVGRLFQELFGEAANGHTPAWAPAVDALETKDALLVTFELPGVDPASIETTVNGEFLEVSGEKPATQKGNDAMWYRFERRAGRFRRRIQLPFPVDLDGVEATARHGLLVIRLPKKPEMMPKKIDVKAE